MQTDAGLTGWGEALCQGLQPPQIAAATVESALAPHDLRWYEEPVAGGENEFTVFGFRRLLDARAVDIAQPDVCAAGGFTACRHIAALPLANPSLHADEPVFEYDCSAHPFRERLVDSPLRQQDGWLELPAGPGLGIEVDRGALERFRA